MHPILANQLQYLTAIFYVNPGTIKFENKNLQEAINYYHLALHIKQENGDEIEGEMHENIAKILMLQKKYKEAKNVYTQALQNTHATILQKAYNYQGLGLAHMRLDEHGDAIKCYEKALKLFFEYYGEENKEFIIYYNEIGYCFSMEKQYEKAITYFQSSNIGTKHSKQIYSYEQYRRGLLQCRTICKSKSGI